MSPEKQISHSKIGSFQESLELIDQHGREFILLGIETPGITFEVRKENIPLQFYINTTPVCNLRCPGCSVGTEINEPKKDEFDPDNITDAIKRECQINKLPITLKYGGGEPMLALGRIITLATNISDTLPDRTIRNIIITNGTIDPEKLRKLLDNSDRNLKFEINFSLWGDENNFSNRGNPELGGVQRVWENIKGSMDLGFITSASYIITPGNAGELVGFIRRAGIYPDLSTSIRLQRPQTPKQLDLIASNIDKISDGVLKAIKILKEEFGNNTTILKGFDEINFSFNESDPQFRLPICMASIGYFAVNGNGDTWPCHQFLSSAWGEQKTLQLSLLTNNGDQLDKFLIARGARICPFTTSLINTADIENPIRKIYRRVAIELIKLNLERASKA